MIAVLFEVYSKSETVFTAELLRDYGLTERAQAPTME